MMLPFRDGEDDARARADLETCAECLVVDYLATHRSRRSIALAAMTVEGLRAHRLKQAEERLALGPAYCDQDLVCTRSGGESWPPGTFLSDIRGVCPTIRSSEISLS